MKKRSMFTKRFLQITIKIMIKKIFIFIRNFCTLSSAGPRFSKGGLDYAYYWKSRSKSGNSALPKRFSIIAKLLTAKSTVLDVGCGDGSLISYLKTVCEITASGVDFSSEAISQAASKGIQCRQADIRSSFLSPGEKYDFIILSEVIEHIAEPEILLANLKQSFNNSLIVTIPNTGYLAYRLRLFVFGRFPMQWLHHPAEHLRYWTLKDFKDWSGVLGFKIKKLAASDGIPLLADLMPGLFASNIVFELGLKK